MRRWTAFLIALHPLSLFAWGELRHTESKGIGYETGYTTLEAFYNLAQEQKWAPFVDLRGHVFDNGRWAANAGLGVRYIDCVTYGANLYYDFRDSHLHSYHQVGFGVEVLSNQWDFRANGYFPVGNKKSRGYDPKFKEFQGHHLILTDLRERALTGGNAELGYHFKRCNWFDIYAAAGPYGFTSKHKAAVGGEARLVAQVNDYLTFQVNGSYDTVYRGIVQGVVGFRLPFGETYCTNKQRIQKVDRHEIIALDHRREKSVAINPATKSPYYFVFVDNTSHSDGTFESPFPTLSLASSNSSPNDVIYVFPGDGTSTGMDLGITLQLDQRLLGSGVQHLLPTQFGTVNIPALSETRPLFTHTASTVVTLDSNNTVSGIAFEDFDTAISGTNITNTRIDKNVMQGRSTNGISLTNVGGSTFIYSNVIDGSDNGIAFTNSNPLVGSASIQGNVLSNNALNGIQMLIGAGSSGRYDALILGNQIVGTGVYGMNLKGDGPQLFFNALIRDNIVIDQTLANIFIDTGREAVMSMSMTNNFLSTTTGQHGFKINAKDQTQVFINVANNTSLGAVRFGIFASSVDTSSLSGNISRNTFDGQGASSIGVQILADNFGDLNLAVRQNHIVNQGLSGIQVDTRAAGQLAAKIRGNRIFVPGIGINFEADTTHTAPGPIGLTTLCISENGIHSDGTGLVIVTDFNYALDLNLIGNDIPQGIDATIGVASGSNVVRATLLGNSVGAFTWIDNSYGENSLRIEGNSFGDTQLLATNQSGNFFLDVENNRFTHFLAQQDESTTQTGQLCLTLDGNESSEFILNSLNASRPFPFNFKVDLGENIGPVIFLPSEDAFKFGSCN